MPSDPPGQRPKPDPRPAVEPQMSDAMAWIRRSADDHQRRLTRWCDQNSWSLDPANLETMAAMLVDDFATSGIPLEAVPLPPLRLLGDDEQWETQGTGPMLVWHHRPESQRRMLLMIHYDTVYPPGSQPDRCRIDGGRLVGPGTADAKGGIAVIAAAVEAMLRFDLAPDVGVSIILNPDEEVGTTASASAIQMMVQDHSTGSAFDRALVFEPTLPDGSLVANRKGSGNFSIVIRGRSAHAGRNPADGRNAIVHAARIVEQLVSMNRPDFGLTVNVGRITGGGPLNRVPDHAAVQLNIRVADDDAMRRAESALEGLARRLSIDDYRVSVVGEFHSPPKRVDGAIADVQHAVARAASVAGRIVGWQDTGGACDGSKLAAWGLPNIDTMGVGGGGLHSPDEFCELESLAPAAVTVAAFIDQFNRPTT